MAEHTPAPIEQRLAALAADYFPATPALRAVVVAAIRAGDTTARPARGPVALLRPRRRLGAAAAVLIAATTLATVPGLRDAVAGFFHLRGVTIERQQVPPTVPPTSRSTAPPSPGPLGTSLGLGTATTVTAARAALAFTPLLPAGLGVADAVYLRTPPLGGALSLVYGPAPGRPSEATDGVSVLITEFSGALAPEFLEKFVGPGTTVEPVKIGADDGLWLAGAPSSVVFRNPDGVQNDDLRLATNTLLWQHGPLLIRIEGQQTREQALAIAASMH